ncbi:response regulator [Telluribacter humicola]|uniref:response regulator n=1 Tax=Telluribacter humicola TaxID=1720261 RepID=UPI001A977301|nr:response regulator [Telluribacter humicola]
MFKNVLLIDDDDLTIDLIKTTLLDNHFAENIHTVSNGREGLAFFEALDKGADGQVPELVLLDVYMPLMNGWEFLDAYMLLYEKKFPQVCFCMLSSSVNPNDILKAHSYNCVIEIFSKPLKASHTRYLEKFCMKRQELFRNKGL